jgi:hypothetical protein
MKMTKSNLTTLGICLVMASLAIVSVAQSQNYSTLISAAASMDSRSAFATNMENQLRQRGIDARVQLDGDARDVLLVEWTTVRRGDIFYFVSSSVADNAKQIGFKTVVFTDGQQRWDYDVARESMVWSPSL